MPCTAIAARPLAITGGGGDYCLALKANQVELLSDARSCFGKVAPDHSAARQEEAGQDRKATRTGTVVSARDWQSIMISQD